MGRLGRLAGGVWGVFGDFGVVFGGFAAVFGGFGTSWGDFGPIFSLLVSPREAQMLIPDSARGPPELLAAVLCRVLCYLFSTPGARQRRGRRILRVRAGSGGTRGEHFRAMLVQNGAP